DPQLAHLALPLLAVPGGIRHRVEVRLAGGLDEPRLRAHPAFGCLEQALVALVGSDAALDSCHEVSVAPRGTAAGDGPAWRGRRPSRPCRHSGGFGETT